MAKNYSYAHSMKKSFVKLQSTGFAKGLAFGAGFGTGIDPSAAVCVTFFDSWVVGAKCAKATLSGAIESGDVGISKVVSAGLSTGFEAFIGVGIPNGEDDKNEKSGLKRNFFVKTGAKFQM